MSFFGLDVPTWVLDWSGSLMVVVSLVYLFRKRNGYWHWSNASLLPYFALFVSGHELMLAGLQASYLVFGVHGLALWKLEHRRDHRGGRFNERAWYNAGRILSLAIFGYTIARNSVRQRLGVARVRDRVAVAAGELGDNAEVDLELACVARGQPASGRVLLPPRAFGSVLVAVRVVCNVRAGLDVVAS